MYENENENSGIMTLSLDVDGYTCDITYCDANGDWHSLVNQTLDLTDSEVFYRDGYVYIQYYIKFPEVIQKGNIVDLSVSINHSSGDMVFANCHARDVNQVVIPLSYTVTETSSTLTNSIYTFSDFSSSSAGIKYFFLRLCFYPSNSLNTFSTSFKTINVVEVNSKGLLSSIIEWIKSIYEGIVNLPSKIANSLKAFFDNIVNAVTSIGDLIVNALTTLGNFIIDGIKNLFIPSEADITSMKEKWNTLLADRFGALYQVANLIHNYATAFTEQNKNTITFPACTVSLAGSDFTFGGWEVQVVPQGFEAVFTVLKTITSILATCLFVNSLHRRFEKILGGADDI